MNEVNRYFVWLRVSLSEQEVRQVGVKQEEDWFLAKLVGGSILMAGLLVLGLVWLGQRDERGWYEQSKQVRSRSAYVHVLNQEEWIRP